MKNSDIFGYSLIIFGLGALAGILIAPRKGEDTRKILKNQISEYCGRACGFITEKAAQINKYSREIKREMEEGE